MDVVVVGGSAGGLFSALLLARAGHAVTVVDGDVLEPAGDVGSAAATAFRPAAPHLVHAHAMLPHFRELLSKHLPDAYDALLRAGALEAPLADSLPPTLTDRSPRPGDEQLTMLLSRRSTVDWVLRRAAAAEPNITIRHATRVTGLVAVAGCPPCVHGVTTGTGPLYGDLVVDASGRRTTVDSWLTAIGARPSVTWRAECGLAYYGRHYRIRPGGGALPGPRTTRLVLPLDEFTAGIWCGDNDTVVVGLAPLVQDRRFKSVTRSDVYTAVLRTVAPLAAWLDAVEPISDVYAMGGLHNTLRVLVDDTGPVVTGLAAVGDSVCTTNPTFGRGMALALAHAVALAASIDRYPDDLSALACDLYHGVAEHTEPFYRDQAANDAARLATLRRTITGEVSPTTPDAPDTVDFPALRTAAQYDPLLLRAFWHVFGMLTPPHEVYGDPTVVARTREVLAELGGAPALPQPSRAALEAALRA